MEGARPGLFGNGARGAGGGPDARRGGGPRPRDETCPGSGGRSGTDGSALGGPDFGGPARPPRRSLRRSLRP